MSFSKIILSYSEKLDHWLPAHETPNTFSEKIFKTIIPMLGAQVEMIVLSGFKHVYFSLKSGSLSKIEMGLLEALAVFIERFQRIPERREWDFFLRDTPSVKALPENFKGDFIYTCIDILTACDAQNFENPLDWLKHQISASKDLTFKEVSRDKIIVEGSKEDAWVIEKNFEQWQKFLRDRYQRPQLLLLFAIKS